MAYNAKLIVQGSSGAKIYIVFKYANVGSQTAPDAFIMLFGNGIPLQRVITMMKYPSGAKWEPFLRIFAVYVKSGSKTTPKWLKNDPKLNTSILGCHATRTSIRL